MTNKRPLSNPYVLTLIAGILLVLSFPPFNMHFLVWVALAPFLYAVVNAPYERKTKWGLSTYRAQVLGILLGSVFYYGTLYWLYRIFGIFGLLLIVVSLSYTFIFAYVLNFVVSKWKNKCVALFFPAVLWVAIEYFKSEGWWLKFSWMNLGYSQHSFLPMLQWASICGQYGVSFLIVLVNSCIVFIIMNRHNRMLAVNTAVAAVLGFGMVFGFGIISLKAEYEPEIKVGLVQDESSDFSVYARLTRQLPDDIDFILWPEYAVPEFLEEEPDLLDQLKELTLRKDSYLILGAKDRAEVAGDGLRVRMMKKQGYPEEEIDTLIRFYNTAYLLSPNGEIIGKYYKVNPIQFFIDGVAGESFPAFETELGRLGIVICYDADYSYVARNITRNGAEMLFIPTYDALDWSELQHNQHSAMTSMRAVENGRFVARATTSGISQIIDPRGRITSSIGIGESGVATGLIARIDKMTFYTRFGFVLPHICIMFSLVIFAFTLSTRKVASLRTEEPNIDPDEAK